MGHAPTPLDFTPHNHCSWSHRFDDPQREFRTLYVAMDRETCFREILASFRPHLSALAQYEKELGRTGLALAGRVKRSWLERKALAQGHLEALSGELIDLRSMDVRGELERRYARTLRDLGLGHLDLSEVQGPSRRLTQFLAGELYRQEGVAGFLYPSKLNGQPCAALFEGHARLEATGEAISLKELMAELYPVLQSFGILLSF